MLWPPVTMATQHPDNAGAPWWHKDPFIPTADEIEEVLLLFRELPIDEYMWDWEGKYVDEAVGEKLFSRGAELFGKRPLGEHVHLTYRIPAFDGDRMHRMARAFMNILSLQDIARDIGLDQPPVTEMFLPLTTTAEQPQQVRTAFAKNAEYHRLVFHGEKAKPSPLAELFEVTPLVEDVQSIMHIESIVRPYWESMLRQGRDLSARGQRIFLARSDPALNAGLVPAVLAIKVAISEVHRIGKDLGFPVHPIIGTGSLPFRGSVNPTYLETFLAQYAGVATYSIQSAFRYDYPLDDVRTALVTIRSEAPQRPALTVSPGDIAELQELCDAFEETWKPTIETIAPLINAVAAHVPPRRERLQHIGLFGYSRGVGKVTLPRAIGFTCALYSIGIPPELIATGRGLAHAEREGTLGLIETYYPALRADLQHAGKFLNRRNLELLASEQPAFADILRGVGEIERILGITLGPQKPHHRMHQDLTTSILRRIRQSEAGDAIRNEIVDAGVIRRSLG